MARHVVIVDKGWNRIRRDMKALQGRGVKVGLRAGSGSNDGVSIVDYATFNEFGTGNVPARPFMRKTADEAEKPVQAFTAGLTREMLAGQRSPDGVLNALGLWFQARIHATIRDARGWAVPNAPSTIKRKGSSAPLIDDRMMFNAVDHEKTKL